MKWTRRNPQERQIDAAIRAYGGIRNYENHSNLEERMQEEYANTNFVSNHENATKTTLKDTPMPS